MDKTNKFSKTIKKLLWQTIITLAVGAVVLLTRIPSFIIIITFVVVDCILGYLYRTKINYLKSECFAKSLLDKENYSYFNAEYFDLYHEFNYNRIVIVFRCLLAALTLTPLIFSKINVMVYITFGIGLMVLSLLILALPLVLRKKDNVIIKLLDKRGENWFGEYTDEELEILRQLYEVKPSKQTTK